MVVSVVVIGFSNRCPEARLASRARVTLRNRPALVKHNRRIRLESPSDLGFRPACPAVNLPINAIIRRL